jgi:hypothetical protein
MISIKTFAGITLLCLTAGIAHAQTEVKQHKVSTDSATGKTTVATETIVKTEEDVSPYVDMLNINPLKFFLVYNLSWMHKLSANTAFGIGAEFGAPHEFTSWGASAEFRFYPSKKSLHGFYVAPNVSYVQTTNVHYYSYDPNSMQSSYGSYTAQTFTAGVLIGWQWFPATDFSMGLAFGVDDYIPLNQKANDNNFDLLGGIYGSGTAPTIRFDLGYAW